jgi:hypothetical protein
MLPTGIPFTVKESGRQVSAKTQYKTSEEAVVSGQWLVVSGRRIGKRPVMEDLKEPNRITAMAEGFC